MPTSNSLLSNKYFNRLYVDRLKAEKSQIVDEYSTLLTPELLNDLNNLVSGVDSNYIPFDTVSDNISLPTEFIKTAWITPSKGNPNISDLLIYTEDGHSLLLENSTGKWDSEYYSTSRLQVVSLQNTLNGFNFLEVGNKECIKKIANSNLPLVGSNISILDMEEWTSVTFYNKSTNTFFYYTIMMNVTHSGGSVDELKNDITNLAGKLVEIDNKINIIFTSNTVKPYVFPLTESPVAISNNLDLDIFTKSSQVYINSGEKTMQASKLLAWASGSEPQVWNNAHNYTGNTNQWPSQLINQAWWCGVGIGTYTETVLTMNLGYYYLDDDKNVVKYVHAPTGEYTSYEYTVVTTVKGEILIASDGTVTVKDVPNILSVISSAPIDAETSFVFAEVFDISTAVPTAKTCYCGIIVNGQDVPCSCQCIYVKTISQELINFINTAVKSPDSITFKNSYP